MRTLFTFHASTFLARGLHFLVGHVTATCWDICILSISTPKASLVGNDAPCKKCDNQFRGPRAMKKARKVVKERDN